MKGTKIIGVDIFGSSNIDINTPIIILHNVTHEYLLPISNDIFNIDIDKLQRDLENRIQFIDRFVPFGQIQLRSYKSSRSDRKNSQIIFTLPMANTRIIHVTNIFEEISKDVWMGIIRKSGRNSRTLGTIKSRGMPKTLYPVFPSTFLIKENTSEAYDDVNEYSDIYSDVSYGHWILNTYKFNVDKTHLKMIDSTGEMSNMYIPKSILPKDILDVGYGDDDYDRKVYFTTQGTIVSDTNCVPPLDNMSKMSIKECNGSSRVAKINRSSFDNDSISVRQSQPVVRANDDDQLTLMLNEAAEYNDMFSIKVKGKTFSKGKKLILREKDEPWFSKTDIVGTAASATDPYKITGIVDGKTTIPLIPLMNVDIIALQDGLVSDDKNEMHAPYLSGCVGQDPAPGYSRYERNKNCGRDNYVDSNEDQNENYIENFNDNNNDTTNLDHINNYIIYAMCFIIILLILYRRK